MDLTFNKNSVLNYWQEKDAELFDLIKQVEPLEYWVLDNNYHTMVYLSFLKESLQEWHSTYLILKANDILQILTYLSFGNMIYLLSYLKYKDPLVFKLYINLAFVLAKNKSSTGILFLERINILANNRKLHHISAQDDALLIMQVLNWYNTLKND